MQGPALLPCCFSQVSWPMDAAWYVGLHHRQREPGLGIHLAAVNSQRRAACLVQTPANTGCCCWSSGRTQAFLHNSSTTRTDLHEIFTFPKASAPIAYLFLSKAYYYFNILWYALSNTIRLPNSLHLVSKYLVQLLRISAGSNLVFSYRSWYPELCWCACYQIWILPRAFFFWRKRYQLFLQ